MNRSLRRSRMVAPARILVAAVLVAASIVVPASPALAADTFLVTGKGYGHGIGLSQWGAQGYAVKGWKYDAILKHYYQHTSVPAKSGVSAGTVKVNLDRAANYNTSSNRGYTKSAWTLAPRHAGAALLVNGTRLVTDAAYQFTPTGTSVKVTRAGTTENFTVSGSASVIETGVATSLVQVAETTGYYNRVNQAYRGRLVLTPNGSASAPRLKLVNHLAMDQYLYGVVPAESPSSWGMEALKAQAVAARSYAYTTVRDIAGAPFYGEMYCTTSHQVYLGYGAEAVRSNSAVNGTVNRVVYYGGVVKAFFFSCSGGHTANIEDVWTGSTPRPYYVGVPDADSGSSLASSWGAAIKYTGSTLAAALRAKSATYSRPSPAIVTAVAITRAPSGSGYAKYVTFTWSDGRTTRPTGDWVRSALGLKSTKFSISKQTNVKRTEQNSSRVWYSGKWYTASSSAHSGRSYAYSPTKGSMSSVKFKGTAVAVIGPKYPHFGRANVYIDGRYIQTISAYSSVAAYRQRLFYRSGLSADTTHTVTVKLTGTKLSASRGIIFGVDAFDVTGGDTVPR
jgi:SpoIID/LytB domain protein